MRGFKFLTPLVLAVLLFVPFNVSPDNSFSTSMVYAGGSAEPPPMPGSSTGSTTGATTVGGSATNEQGNWSSFDQFLLHVTLLILP